MKQFTHILIILGLYSCSGQLNSRMSCYPKDDLISDSYGFPKDSIVSYFPGKIFRDNGYVSTEPDTIYQNRSSIDLSSLNEPVLYNFYLNKEIYRLIKVCHFKKPMLIKIEKNGNKIIISKKVVDRFNLLKKSYKPRYELPLVVGVEDSGIIAENRRKIEINKSGKIDLVRYPEPRSKIISFEEKELKMNDWKHFKRLLENSRFWEQPIYLKYSVQGNFDGCGYILEGHTKDKYWFVQRSDMNSSELQACFNFFVENHSCPGKIMRFFASLRMTSVSQV